jgi:phasin
MAINPTAGYDVPPEMRDFAEKSVDQARKALDGFLGAAHKAVDTLQGSSTTLQSTATDTTRKTLSYAEQNLAAAFDHAQKLVRAKDFQEAVAIQTEFAKTQFQAMQSQVKELAEIAQAATRTAASHATSAAQNATNQAAANMRSATE